MEVFRYMDSGIWIQVYVIVQVYVNVEDPGIC